MGDVIDYVLPFEMTNWSTSSPDVQCGASITLSDPSCFDIYFEGL